MTRLGKALAAGWIAIPSIVGLAGCEVSVATDRPAVSAPIEAGPLEIDTLYVRCPVDVPFLRSTGSIPIGMESARLIPTAGGLLVVGEDGGLFHLGPGGRQLVLEGGRDYALHGNTLFRLSGDTITLYAYRSREPPLRIRALPGQTHDVSMAALDSGIFVHSPAQEGALVLRRSIDTGEPEKRLFPTDRNLLWAAFTDPGRFLEDAGVLRGDGGWLLFVPRVRDPVEAIDLATGRRLVLYLGGEARGAVRTLEKKVLRDDQACPDCTRHVAVELRHEIDRLFADAAVRDGSAWVLELDPPGSSGGLLLRVPLAGGAIAAWRLPSLPTPPAALAVGDASLVVAAGKTGSLYRIPDPSTGAICSAE